MKIKVVKQPLSLCVVTNQMFHTVYRWLPIITHQIVTIQIISFSVQSIETLLNSIRIQHWHYYHLKMFSYQLGFLTRSSQKINYPFDCPTGSTFTRMDSTTDEYDRFLKIFFRLL